MKRAWQSAVAVERPGFSSGPEAAQRRIVFLIRQSGQGEHRRTAGSVGPLESLGGLAIVVAKDSAEALTLQNLAKRFAELGVAIRQASLLRTEA